MVVGGRADRAPPALVRGTIPGVTPTSPTVPPTPAGPTHGCARCGAPVPMGVGLCERCNPLGLRDVSASQVHATAFIGVIVAFVVLAIVARFAVNGIGPFPATLDSVVPGAGGVTVTLTVTNKGSAGGQTTCRVTQASNRGGGPNAFLLSPNMEPGQTVTFSQFVTDFGAQVDDLTAECRTP